MKNAYLMKEKKLSDVRIFQPKNSRVELYKFPQDYLIIARKYVDKLKDQKFTLKGNNYFMIHFVPNLMEGEIAFEKETKWDPVGKGKQEVNIGVEPKVFNKLPEHEKSSYITNTVANVLTKTLRNYDANTKIIEDIKKEILNENKFI